MVAITQPSVSNASSVATALVAGLMKPDGVTLTVASDGTISVVGVSVPGLPAKTDSLGTDIIPMYRPGVGDISQAVSAFLAANQTSVTALPAGPGLAGADTIAIYSASAAGDVKYSITQLVAFIAAQLGSSSSATTFSVTASSSSVVVGSTVTLTVTPGTGGWPSGQVVTAVVTTITGTFDAATKTGTGTTPVIFTFTATGSAASGSLSAIASGMSLSGSAAPLATTIAPVVPGQIGSLTLGTPTSTTIPVTYTAATGTATITYTGQTKPHGSGSYTSNGGTFTATGGTFTGLSASTNYDLQITATNSAGSSTTTLTTGVTTASGSAYPSLTLTSGTPTYPTGRFSQGLSGTGVFSMPFNIPVNAAGNNQGRLNLGFFFKSGTTAPLNKTKFLWIVDSSGQYHAQCVFQNSTALTMIDGGTFNTGANFRDGAQHHFRTFMDTATFFNSYYYIDGGSGIAAANGQGNLLAAGAATLFIDFTQLDPSDVLDEITGDISVVTSMPTAEVTRDSNSLFILHLNGSGTGS